MAGRKTTGPLEKPGLTVTPVGPGDAGAARRLVGNSGRCVRPAGRRLPSTQGGGQLVCRFQSLTNMLW